MLWDGVCKNACRSSRRGHGIFSGVFKYRCGVDAGCTYFAASPSFFVSFVVSTRNFLSFFCRFFLFHFFSFIFIFRQVSFVSYRTIFFFTFFLFSLVFV